MQAGYVTTTELGPAIGELIAKQDRTVSGFAESLGCDEATIRRLVAGEYSRLRFDFVDRVLCELGAVHLWWGEFNHLYEEVEFKQTCQSPLCNKMFPEKVVRQGVKLYCSKRCNVNAHKIKRGVYTGNRLRNECPKGHKFTPENTGRRASGRRVCLACNRERRRLKMQDPAQREKQREYERKCRTKAAA